MPDTSTTECCFHFVPASLFLLELLSNYHPLFSSNILNTFWSGSLIPMSYLLSFHTIHDVLTARILVWFANSFSSRPHFPRSLLMIHLSWLTLYDIPHSFISYASPVSTTRLWSLKGFDPLAFYKHETGGKRHLSTIDGIFFNAFFICGHGRGRIFQRMELVVNEKNGLGNFLLRNRTWPN